MALQTPNTTNAPSDIFDSVRSTAVGAKAQAQNALTFMQNNSVNSTFIFNVVDSLRGLIGAFLVWQPVVGLDAYATSQGYTGTMSADISTCSSAAQAVIAWVVANFPASGGFLQSETLNSDGSRTLRTFTPAQTAGFQTAMQSFIATIG